MPRMNSLKMRLWVKSSQIVYPILSKHVVLKISVSPTLLHDSVPKLCEISPFSLDFMGLT